jgi:hypothetical protein
MPPRFSKEPTSPDLTPSKIKEMSKVRNLCRSRNAPRLEGQEQKDDKNYNHYCKRYCYHGTGVN